MNKGVLLTESTTNIIDAQVWVDGQTNPLNDEIMESDGVTLQQIFFGDYAGPGPGPAIPMNPVDPENPKDVFIPEMARLYEASDIRVFGTDDNRIFEA